MHRIASLAMFAAAAAALVTSGCQPKLYRAETVLKADGSVSRAIYQPIEATPHDAQQPGAWSGSTYAARIPHQQWRGDIAALPPAERSEQNNYFAAWGQFDSPDAMPRAFVKTAPEGLADGKLVVDYQRDDYGLVVEYRWKETLTDIVAIDDMHQAREELADLLIPLGQKILERALGDEYDTSGLAEWFQQQGKPWFYEATDVVFATGARGDFSEETLVRALAPVCARHGLVLTEASGQLVEGEAAEGVIAAFAKQTLRDHLRRRDGREVPGQVIDEIVQFAGIEARPENSDEQLGRYDEAAETVIAEQFGGMEKLEAAATPLVARLLGLYAGELFGFPHHFQYTLETPGPIVKTNGTLVSDRQVRWTFEGVEAYPFGYTMECESLAVQSELETQLLGRPALTTRAAMVDYLELVRSDETLRQAIVACAAEKSLAPFYKARNELGWLSESKESFDAMRRLLGLPDQLATQ
jgi:hypothetical protein